MSVDIKNYGDADKKLIKKLTAAGKFDASLDRKLNIEKVNVEVMVRWVNERLTELLGFEDDVVVNLVENMLTQTQDAFSGQVKRVDPKQLQIQLTGFLDRQAAPFVAELWKLLLDAQDSPHGIPRAFVERKKQELVARREAGGDRDHGGFSKREDRGDDRRARSRSRSRDRGGREADQRRVVRAASNRGRSRSRSRERRKKRSGFSSAPAAPAPPKDEPPPGKPSLPAPWRWKESRKVCSHCRASF